MRFDDILAVLVFFPFLAGVTAYFSGKKCQVITLMASAVEMGIMVCAVLLYFNPGYGLSRVSSLSQRYGGGLPDCFLPEICGFGLHFCMDGFRLVYSCVAVFMWMMAALLSVEYFKDHHHVKRFYLFLLWTQGATLGVFLSGDLYTAFLFFEVMSFTSYVWVAQEENRPSLKAAGTYLGVAVIGGLVMLMGILLLYHFLGTLVIGELRAAAETFGNRNLLYAAGACILFGFGAKAGAFPLHIWLPKAHPVAPAPASALLSGILTKAGVYGILLLSCNLFLYDGVWGRLILVLGVITMLGGALLAVFSIDLKRTLACSSMSQIGFILTGIGIQGMLGESSGPAVHGTMLHMVNHSLIKLVLFLAAGVIYRNTHLLDLNLVRGFGRKKPLLKVIFLTGALAIGGIPLFGGYVSKTLLHEAIVEYGGGRAMKAVEWLFLISGGLTVAYMTKLYVAVFVEKNSDVELQKRYDEKKKYMSRVSAFALGGSALILFLWGLIPHLTMDRVAKMAEAFMNYLPDSVETPERVQYFSFHNLIGGLISIAIGGAVYLILIRKKLIRRDGKGTEEYVNLWPAWLDLEELLYRPLFLKILPVILAVACRVLDSLTDVMVVALRRTVYRDSPLPHELPEGNGLTLALGRVMNGIQSACNRIWRKNAPVERDYVHLFALWDAELQENNRIIQRSLSFGLLMFCGGLALTLVYIIWF